MADRTVATTDTLDTLRTTYNLTAADVGDIASVTSASGVIASATDIVEAITLMNTELRLQLQTQRQTGQLLSLMLLVLLS